MLPVDRHTEDALVALQVFGLIRRDVWRKLQRRYAVRRDAAPLDLERLDPRGVLVALQELLKPRMDARKESALELRVAVGRAVVVQVGSDPLEPCRPGGWRSPEVLSGKLVKREDRLLEHGLPVDEPHQRDDDGHHGLVTRVPRRFHPVDGQFGVRREFIEDGAADPLEDLGHREHRIVLPGGRRRGDGGWFLLARLSGSRARSGRIGRLLRCGLRGGRRR